MSYPNPNPNPILGHNFIAPSVSNRNLYKILSGGHSRIGHYYVLHIHVYRRCIWMVYTCILIICISVLYTCILIVYMGVIYMYVDCVYGCYMHVY
jgi:hypothetical protein